MWRIVPASAIGTAHERAGTPCQDSCAFLRTNTEDGEIIILALADGAGSAKYSHIGSAQAVQHLLSTVSHAQPALNQIRDLHARQWMQSVRIHLEQVAESRGIKVDELACTLLMAIIGKDSTVLAQIGDGAWVIEKDGAIYPATWPQNGEYANLTTFITSECALGAIQFVRIEGSVSAIAGFTDGIQTLALTYATKQAHSPFFSPIFQALRECDDEAALTPPLHRFLSSEAVAERTDDDKTLLIACWCEKDVDANRDCR
jgi:hypothetical protein